MSIMINWNPVQEMFPLDDAMSHSLLWAPEAAMKKNEVPSAWSPAADMYETEDAILIQVELTGINKDSLSVVFHNGYLVLEGTRPFQTAFQTAQVYRIERSYGFFQRSFWIPKPIDANQIVALYEQGILTITLTKVAPKVAETIKIPVNVE
jgi:HSP20 family protein